ncbi:MAG: hypothetical protein CMP62_04930 [Flavobacteriales bacterium]|nr:hypothetical protein [Flavobacteriales bacterium]
MIKMELITYGFNHSVRNVYGIKSIPITIRHLLIKLIFIIISCPLFSQSLFKSNLKPLLLDIDNPSDIRSLNMDSLEFWTYNQVPDLSHLSTYNRKQKFIDLILPSILIEKSKIKTAYNYVLDNFDNIYLNKKTESLYHYCNCTTPYELLLCLTEQPNSIIIAQAAIESGWGTSRFFVEGFNLFGIHSYGKNEQSIQATNDSLVYVKKYNSILESISDYLRILATVNVYSEFRKQRVISDDVYKLINYLTSYSERRQLYIDDIKSIIDFNDFVIYDTLKISN